MEVFWIGEVCDADRRAKLITKEAREWFATRTISQAIVSYQEKPPRQRWLKNDILSASSYHRWGKEVKGFEDSLPEDQL